MLRSPNRVRLIFIGMVGLALMACLGCGGDGRLKTVPVKVTVTLDGNPVGPGTIMYLPKGTEKQASGQIDAQGNATASSYGDNDGLTLGEFRVIVTPPMGTASQVPGVYGDTSNSPLTVKVDSSTTEVKVALLSSAGPPAPPAGGVSGAMSSQDMMKQFSPKTE